ncbi:MAG: glycosyltransferase [Desulfomonilaceae bacterium]|nr:glycosyltransferase [Desulfomonilaceae bacterium]
MNYLGGGLAVWFLLTVIPLVTVLVVGLTRIRAARRHRVTDEGPVPVSQVEILVPLKGRMPEQEKILTSLLEQRYPRYDVVFVLESEDDPGNVMVDELCSRYSHARKVISGVADVCAQKNHGLVAGVGNLRPETEILVFCDSTNAAAPDWLEYFTAPLRSGEAQAVSTFRAFDPRPETLAGVCQAIYASFILVLLMIKPKPWGGATGIRRAVFEALNVAEAWSRTVVDDLVLGNILDRARIDVHMRPRHLLRSPLRNQTVEGFLSYLDRQILFPKFTNPGIWFVTLTVILSLTLASYLSLAVTILFLFGYGEPYGAWICLGFLAVLGSALLVLRRVSPFPVSVAKWVSAFFPLLALASFVYLRSIVVNHIDWHGRRYRPGKGGVVLCTTYPSSGNDLRELS